MDWPTDITLGFVHGSLQGGPEDDVAKFEPEVGMPETQERSTVIHEPTRWQFEATFAKYRDSFLPFYLEFRAQIFTRPHPHGPANTDLNWKFEERPTYVHKGGGKVIVTVSCRRVP